MYRTYFAGYDAYDRPVYLHAGEEPFVTDDDIIPTCDLCGGAQLVDDEWNGETGNHFACEKQEGL